MTTKCIEYLREIYPDKIFIGTEPVFIVDDEYYTVKVYTEKTKLSKDIAYKNYNKFFLLKKDKKQNFYEKINIFFAYI